MCDRYFWKLNIKALVLMVKSSSLLKALHPNCLNLNQLCQRHFAMMNYGDDKDQNSMCQRHGAKGA